MCVCLCVRMCVRERERETGLNSVLCSPQTNESQDVYIYIYIYIYIYDTDIDFPSLSICYLSDSVSVASDVEKYIISHYWLKLIYCTDFIPFNQQSQSICTLDVLVMFWCRLINVLL